MKIPYPAVTVVLLRDTNLDFEVLLIHRNPDLSFFGGGWTFPGGRIEAEDYRGTFEGNILEAARQAAVRETKEETGIRILTENLFTLSRWTTPEDQPRRFDTWFFLAVLDDQPVIVDGKETLDHRWVKPKQVPEKQKSGEIVLLPPTFVTIQHLSQYRSTRELLLQLADRPVLEYLPRIRLVSEGFCSLYQGDVAYDGGNLNQPGSRHRLWGLNRGWHYERTI